MAPIRDTRDYHRHHPVDLMTEWTVCETFGSIDSPFMPYLDKPKSYGAIIGDRLREWGLLRSGSRLCEIGGGYGTLMRGLLEAYGEQIEHIVMMDVSRSLLERQKKTLALWEDMITYIEGDITEMIPDLSGGDVVILNEMIGDLDTWTELDPEKLPREVSSYINQYGLEIPCGETFNFNLGAVSLVQEICRRGIPAFISEHSSDPIIPEDMDYLAKGLMPDGYPREIKLHGHSEFTIRFSHLVRVAEATGRKPLTGSMIDLLGLKRLEKMETVFRSRLFPSEEQEMIFELLDHIREYRWLMIQ
jgi:hypothetical protein